MMGRKIQFSLKMMAWTKIRRGSMLMQMVDILLTLLRLTDERRCRLFRLGL